MSLMLMKTLIEMYHSSTGCTALRIYTHKPPTIIHKHAAGLQGNLGNCFYSLSSNKEDKCVISV